METERDTRRRRALGDEVGGREHGVDRAERHRTQSCRAREISPRQREMQPPGDSGCQLDIESTRSASICVDEWPTPAARRHRQVSGCPHRQRHSVLGLTERYPPHAFGSKQVDLRRPGDKLAVEGEAIGVRESGVRAKGGKFSGDGLAGLRASTEGTQQHASHIPRLGAIHPGSRAVLGLEVVDEPARLGSRRGAEINARACHDRSVTGAGCGCEIRVGLHRGRPENRNGRQAGFRHPGA